jgi:hypothetical protein
LQRSRRICFDLILSWKLIMPIIQRRVGRHQMGQSEEQTTQWSKGQNIHIKTRWLHIKVQEVCNAVYELRRDKELHLKVQSMSPTWTTQRPQRRRRRLLLLLWDKRVWLLLLLLWGKCVWLLLLLWILDSVISLVNLNCCY